MGQGIGTLFGLITAFAMTFVVLTFGTFMPNDLIASTVVADFLVTGELEIRLAVTGTILYPAPAFLGSTSLGSLVGYGSAGASVLMWLAWGTGGLVAGLFTKDIFPGILSGVFSAVIGAFLTWLLFFIISPGFDVMAIFQQGSLLIMQASLEGTIFPVIACAIGGLLGGAITRDR
ncbi:MAG: hypothetical protein KGD60_06960 [Candidatus Thorarchaeota archaeon]|nr:hypothetical protein [Candidatus Thorarchaeota archaeon]